MKRVRNETKQNPDYKMNMENHQCVFGYYLMESVEYGVNFMLI